MEYRGLTYVLKVVLIGLIMWGVAGCRSFTVPKSMSQTKPSHQVWDDLLKQHVDAEGWVSYQGFISDKEKLESYLALLSGNPPAETWSEAEQLAYWINAYNAFTVKLIIDHYPLKSIRELHTIPLVATAWHIKFFEIGGEEMNLDQIEHKILRKDFEEPRIHFAINCASVSCPVLRAEAYTAERLEAQLEEQARLFFAQPLRNRISEDKLELSAIFQWFKGDFTKRGSLRDFVQRYTEVEIQPDARIKYLKYDWSLNERPQVVK